jgi:hypothetical protein
MPRAGRVDVEGGVYHVYNRTGRGEHWVPGVRFMRILWCDPNASASEGPLWSGLRGLVLQRSIDRVLRGARVSRCA